MPFQGIPLFLPDKPAGMRTLHPSHDLTRFARYSVRAGTFFSQIQVNLYLVISALHCFRMRKQSKSIAESKRVYERSVKGCSVTLLPAAICFNFLVFSLKTGILFLRRSSRRTQQLLILS